jgi:hypothetical protein
MGVSSDKDFATRVANAHSSVAEYIIGWYRYVG